MNRALRACVLVLVLIALHGCAGTGRIVDGWHREAGRGPTVLWASDPVTPGDTAMIIGDGLAALQRIEIVNVAGGAVYAADPLQLDDRSVKFVLPTSLAPGVHAVRLVTATGSTVVKLNAPSITWTSGNEGPEATPGGSIRLFGRCLDAAEGSPTIRLENSGKSHVLNPSAAGPWSLTAALPANVAPGDYTVCIHNGAGGAHGWSDPAAITVRAAQPWPTAVLNVRDFGAVGDGQADDTAAVQQALEKARTDGGAIVHLPRGRYKLTQPIEIPSNTILHGEKREWTEILWPDTDEPPLLMVAMKRHTAVEDVTFYCANYQHFIGNDTTDENAGDVHIRRIRIRAVMYRGHLKPEQVDERFRKSLKLSTGGGDTIHLRGDNLEVAECDLYGSGRSMFLLRPRGAVVRDNRMFNGRWGWYSISGADGVVFENNTLTGGDLMSTGGGINCLYGVPFSQNVYYAGNDLSLMHGWDREAMTSDAGGGPYAGTIASADGRMITLAGDPDWRKRSWAGAAVFVLDGKGMGQYRRIVKHDGRVIELDEPWTIVPDATSIISVTMLQRNYMFVDNSFADASVAMQYYGISIGHIAAGNRSSRTAGFKSMALNYHGIQPSWYCQWLSNRIDEGNFYQGGSNQSTLAAEAMLDVSAHPRRSDWYWPMSLGTVVRGNVLESNAHISIGARDVAGPDGAVPAFVRDVVVEHNTVRHADRGVRVHRDTTGVLVRENVFEHVGEPVRDEAAIARAQAAAWAALIKGREPIAVWNFDGGDAQKVVDITGNDFTAVADGDVRFDEGVRGRAVVLGGTAGLEVQRGQIIRMPHWTGAAWIKPADVSGRTAVIAKRTTNQSSPFVLSVREGRLAFDAADTENKWTFNVASEPVIKAGEWQHVAAVVESGRGVTLYVNGQAVARRANAGSVAQNDQSLWIGRDAWGGIPADTSRPGYFSGAIDDVKIWARPLTAEEVAAEAKRGG
jgi:hypothetical protein